LSIFQREAALLEAILNRGIQSGAFKPVDVTLTASLIQQIFRYLDTPGSYFSGRKDLAKRVDFALDILLHGLEKRP
jgi:hypothetical protein